MASSLLNQPLEFFEGGHRRHEAESAEPHHVQGNEALEELMYSRDAFFAVALPTSLCTIISSLCVVFINDGQNGQSQGGVGIPVVREANPTDTASQALSTALINALAIIGAIICMTFLLVTLYYFNFMRVLFAWLMGSTALLLAFSTGLVVQTALSLWNIPADALTYWFVFYNFAVGGVVAIYFGSGIPLKVTQGYLICIAVTMAWVLIRFLPDWTTWALLALLAVYDLCAVLTPCGPLKWLVSIMRERDQPLPGLLYEAQVGERTNGGGGAPSSSQAPSASRLPQQRHGDGGGVLAAPASDPTSLLTSAERAPAVPTRPDRAAVRTAMVVNSSPPPFGSHGTRSIPAAEQPPPHPREAGLVNRERHDADDDDEDDNTIKLGLGDFVFYSILASKSALVSFTTFIIVFLVIQVGLAGTMLLLAIYKQALPALPLSIFLGLLFFFVTDVVMVPWVSFNAAAMQMV